jgi:hypothetical protein
MDAMVTELKASNAPLEALAFVEANYSLMEELGFDAFSEVVNLYREGQPDQAVLVLEANLGPAEIIQMENKVAGDLKAAIELHEKFKRELQTFALDLVPIVIKVGVAIVSGGIAL